MSDAEPTSETRPLLPHLRVVFPGDVRIGPGKVELLEAIGRTGSISAAGRELGMSYRRAWLLVDAVNGLFRFPAVTTATGGAHGGGAVLTPFGARIVAAYRRVETHTQAAIDAEMAELLKELREPPVT